MWRVFTRGLYDLQSLISSEVEDVRAVWLFSSVIPTGTTCTEPEASDMVETIRGHGRNNRVDGRKLSRRDRWYLIYRIYCLAASFIRYISRS